MFVCVCVCVCVGVCTDTQTHTHTRTHFIQSYMWVCLYIFICMYACVCVCSNGNMVESVLSRSSNLVRLHQMCLQRSFATVVFY